MNTLMSNTVWAVMCPKTSTKKFIKLLTVSILILIVGLMSSCAVRVTPFEVSAGFVGSGHEGHRGGYGGGGQQVTTVHSTPAFNEKDHVGVGIFQSQPPHHIQGCQLVTWGEKFPTWGLMVNDQGSFAEVQRIPVGLKIWYHPQTHWAWIARCDNRVIPAPVNSTQTTQYSAPQRQYCEMVPYAHPYPSAYNNSAFWSAMPYCERPQPRIVFVPNRRCR